MSISESQAVKDLGENIGYGHLMNLASNLWKESMKRQGLPTSGVFIPVLECDIQSSKVNLYIG